MDTLNAVDIAILAVFLGSIIAGLVRGFVKEMISLVTWIAAFIVSISFSSRVAAAFTSSSSVSGFVANTGVNATQPISMLAIGVSFVALFIGTLLVGSLLNYFVSSLTNAQGIGFGNRLLGGAFGLARAFLINLIVLFLVQLSPLSQQAAFAESKFVISYQPAIKWVDDFVQPGIASLKAKMGNVNPSGYLQEIKDNYKSSGASQFFQPQS